MQIEVRGFKGKIINMQGIVIQKNAHFRLISYNITLYIEDRKATVELKNVKPEEIRILEKESDYIKKLRESLKYKEEN